MPRRIYHVVTIAFQQPLERQPHLGVVVDQKHRGTHIHGLTRTRDQRPQILLHQRVGMGPALGRGPKHSTQWDLAIAPSFQSAA
jgi:hypothetical protein